MMLTERKSNTHHPCSTETTKDRWQIGDEHRRSMTKHGSHMMVVFVTIGSCCASRGRRTWRHQCSCFPMDHIWISHRLRPLAENLLFGHQKTSETGRLSFDVGTGKFLAKPACFTRQRVSPAKWQPSATPFSDHVATKKAKPPKTGAFWVSKRRPNTTRFGRHLAENANVRQTWCMLTAKRQAHFLKDRCVSAHIMADRNLFRGWECKFSVKSRHFGRQMMADSSTLSLLSFSG